MNFEWGIETILIALIVGVSVYAHGFGFKALWVAVMTPVILVTGVVVTMWAFGPIWYSMEAWVLPVFPLSDSKVESLGDVISGLCTWASVLLMLTLYLWYSHNQRTYRLETRNCPPPPVKKAGTLAAVPALGTFPDRESAAPPVVVRKASGGSTVWAIPIAPGGPGTLRRTPGGSTS